MTLFTQMQATTRQRTVEKQKYTRTDRRRFTDSVQVLVEMASFQNSKNAKQYYIAIGKLIKGITHIEARSEATATQKSLERTLQLAARGEILKGVELGVYYKNIFRNIKKKLLGIEKLMLR